MGSTRQKTFRVLRTALSVSIVFLFILLVSPGISFANSSQIILVSDGDTIKLRSAGSKSDINIRLVEIDAPETPKKKNDPGQPFSQTAKKYLAYLVLNKFVDIKSYGTDRYGRSLAVVYRNGTNVNLEMVKAGLAEVYHGQPAKGFDNDPYWKAEKEARETGRGIWSLGDKYVSPREWRKMGK